MEKDDNIRICGRKNLCQVVTSTEHSEISDKCVLANDGPALVDSCEP